MPQLDDDDVLLISGIAAGLILLFIIILIVLFVLMRRYRGKQGEPYSIAHCIALAASVLAIRAAIRDRGRRRQQFMCVRRIMYSRN